MIADPSTLRLAFFGSRPSGCGGLALCLSALLLTACAGAPNNTTDIAVKRDPDRTTAAPIPAKPEQAIDIAAFSRVEQAARERGDAAAWATRNALLTIGLDTTTLALIDSSLAWLAGDIQTAESLLNGISEMDDVGRQRVQQLREARAAAQHRWLDAAALLHQRLADNPELRPIHNDLLFNYLMHLSDDQLQSARLRANDADWQGWIELMIAYHQGRVAVSVWINTHATHSNLPTLPAGLESWLNQSIPRQLAVMLPISGRLSGAANAVLSGIVEALYSQYRDPSNRPRLTTIDTERYPDAISAYQAAVDGGAEVVIGPLTKARSRSLASLQQRPVPVIALNRPEALPERDAQGWNSLSLAPEDEARQLASLAFADNLRNALIVAPDTDWGRRMSASLSQEWRRLGGKISAQANINEDVPASQTIAETLGASASEIRINNVEDAFDAAVSARARRRSDIDTVFLLASSPAEARSLRPLLVFHYGGDLPVFAPSSINADSRNLSNQDLNGVRFVEIPAVLSTPHIDRYTRLQALGRDAITLVEHLQQSAKTTAATVRGETGLLKRRRNGEIERELNSVVFAGDSIKSR